MKGYKFSFLLMSLLSLSALSFKASAVASQSNEREIMIANFDTFDDIYNVHNVLSNYQMTGYFTMTGDDDPNAIEGHSLDVYMTGSACSSWIEYTVDYGFPGFIYYNLWSNTKNNGLWGFNWNHLSGWSVDIYNPNDFAMDVVLFNMTSDYFPVNNNSIRVMPHETTTLEIKVNRYFMQSEFQRKIDYVCLMIDYDKTILPNGELYYEPCHIYFDNLKCFVNENDVRDEQGFLRINKTFKDSTEILSFSDESDLDYMYEVGGDYALEKENEWITRTRFTGTGVGISYNTNKKYIKGDNKGSLKWNLNPTFMHNYMSASYRYLTERGLYNTTLWSCITVCGDYLDWYNFSMLLTGEYKIQIDVYNDNSFAKEVGFGIHGKNGISRVVSDGYPYNYGALHSTDVFTRIPAHEWATLEIDDFSELDMSDGLARLRLVVNMTDTYSLLSFYCSNLRLVRK